MAAAMTTDRFARISERAIRCRELSATDWRVLACIALHADASGRAYPSMATIAEMTGIRRKDAPRTVRRLEQLRHLRCDPGAGPGGANVYILKLDDAEVSAGLRTVRNGADSECPQDCGQGVRNGASKVSARVRTKQTIEQTNEHIRAGEAKTASEFFDTFWRIYPSRGGHANPKKPARAKFDAAVKRGVDPELIVAAARNYASFMARSGTAGKYVKTAEVWLNKASWEQYGAPEEPEPLRAGMI
jgi:hypothetical protein